MTSSFARLPSIYHQIDEQTDGLSGKSDAQIRGKAAHKSIDEQQYSTSSSMIQGIAVYSSDYDLYGMIDVYDLSKKRLIKEREL